MSATTAFAIDCVSGALSGMAAVAVGHPFDTLRTQVQVHAGEASPWKLAANLVKHEGVAGLFRGILPPLFAVGLASTVAFSVNEEAKSLIFAKMPQNPSSFARNTALFTAGTISGMFVTLVSAPTFFLKVQLQTMKSSYAATHPFRATVDAARRIHRELGWGGLYYGVKPQLVVESVGRGFYFSVYEVMKSRLGLYHQSSEHTFALRLVAAVCAGSFMWTVMMPLDVVRSNIMATTPQRGVSSPGVWETALRLHTLYGWRVFYRGLGVTLIRSIPVSGTVLPMFDYTRDSLRQRFL